MWRALAVFVFLILATGVYAIVTGTAATPGDSGAEPDASSFGFALAAGAIALAATLMVGRPRWRFRR